jgi:signal recognition particle subunit SRP54
MFEELTQKIDGVLRKLIGKKKLSENDVKEALAIVKKTLIEADVNYNVVQSFIDKVTKKALDREIVKSLVPGQFVLKIFYDELKRLLGEEKSEIKVNANGVSSYLIIGLQGSGKTTFSAKFAKRLKERDLNPLLVAADIYRPAAIDQLIALGEKIGVKVFHKRDVKDAVSIAEEALSYAKENGFKSVIIDTAGRLHVDDDMMKEAANIKASIKPTETLFVVDSMTGQDAVNSAKAFNDQVGFDGIILSKLDGDTRGGCALSIRAVTEKPIKFISIGEKIEDIDYFYPDRIANRIVGQGDLISLIEKAEKAIEEQEALELEEKFKKNEFDFNDFLKQINMIRKMGSLKSLVGMLPGIGSQLANAKFDERQLIKTAAMIQSMTKEERKNPQILNASRKNRIAKGSGCSVQEVNNLIVQYNNMLMMMKNLNKTINKKEQPSFLQKLKKYK